jgi:RHS repeat-associated protein
MKEVSVIEIFDFTVNTLAASTSFGGGRINKTDNNSYDINYFITDHLGSTRVIVNANGEIKEQKDFYPFGKEHENPDLMTSTNRWTFSGKEKQIVGGVNFLDFSNRMYDDFTCRWTTPDPLQEQRPWISSYVFCSNNPIGRIDPMGLSDFDWKPDEMGNLIAESGDNAWTLAKYQNIKPQEAITQLNEQGYTINDKGILNLKVGDNVTLDNVYTQNLESHGDLPAGNSELNYNCWGSAIAGVEGTTIQNGVGIDTPSEFDSKLQSNFSSVDNSQSQFGKTIIRFAEDNPYQGTVYNGYAQQGLVSRNPNDIGGASHGAVYYGTSQNGTVYVYTKNGWYDAPKIMTLQQVQSIYGNVSGLNNGSGYYNKK